MDAQEFRATLDSEHIVAQRAVEGGPQAGSLDVLFASAESRFENGVEQEKIHRCVMKLDNDFERLIAKECQI